MEAGERAGHALGARSVGASRWAGGADGAVGGPFGPVRPEGEVGTRDRAARTGVRGAASYGSEPVAREEVAKGGCRGVGGSGGSGPEGEVGTSSG